LSNVLKHSSFKLSRKSHKIHQNMKTSFFMKWDKILDIFMSSFPSHGHNEFATSIMDSSFVATCTTLGI